jgi:HPt (histidine-containing phosphotransfer) domain-containing protein
MTAEFFVSEYANDPEMAEFVTHFSLGLSGTAGQLRRALEAGDQTLVKRIGLQLNGAGGEYGFTYLSQLGRALEESVKEAGGINADVLANADRLMDLCDRISELAIQQQDAQPIGYNDCP